jgi:RHS repeat-associated protein
VTKRGEAMLFNGNIRYMQTRLMNPTTLASMPMLNAYKYDQLNRLKESRSYETGLSSAIWNPTTYGNSYYNAFNYDAMGNILTQVRHKRSGTKIEDMNYKYQYLDPTTKTKLQRNRLYHIYEPLSLSGLDATDIDNMGAYDSTAVNINVANNYSYDEEGRLVKDTQEGISKIVWRVDGKVKEIQRPTGTKKWLRFDYDAMGHRIAKHVYNNTGTTLERSTYYVLDAQGNQISMYDHEVVGGTAQYNLKERNIFGSSRIGSKQDSMNVLTATITQNYTQILGTKYYEFSNHLGNVLTVYSDVKIPLDADADYVVEGFRVPIRNIADYSPFGVQLDGRTITMDSYRYGYQGSEKDDESKGGGNSYTTFFRQLDPRVGRWFSIDPKMSAWESPYVSMGNNPILNNDILGDTITKTDAFNKQYSQAYEKFSQSKAGKKFIADYSVGGKYENVSVVFDLQEEAEAGVGGETITFAINKSGGKPIELNGTTLSGASPYDLITGKTNFYVQIKVLMNPSYGLPGFSISELDKVKAGASILHETQHVYLSIIALYHNLNIPSPYKQHETLDSENEKYYWERVNYWWLFTPVWISDFKEQRNESIKSEKYNKTHKTNNYSPMIFKPIDYINKQDEFTYGQKYIGD